MAEFADGVENVVDATDKCVVRIVDCKSVVSPDGDFTRLVMRDESGREAAFEIGVEHIGEIVAECQTAMNWMTSRQRLKLDQGARSMEDIHHVAKIPCYLVFHRSPHLSEYMLSYRIPAHAPMALRLTIQQVYDLKMQIGFELLRSMN